MAHGEQLDWHSCGIVVPNTIVHDIKGTPLWEQRYYALERIRWFIRLGSNERVSDEDQGVVNHTIEDLDHDTNVLLAKGDHNFPDLKEFVLAIHAQPGELGEGDMPVEETDHGQSRLSMPYHSNVKLFVSSTRL